MMEATIGGRSRGLARAISMLIEIIHHKILSPAGQYHPLLIKDERKRCTGLLLAAP